VNVTETSLAALLLTNRIVDVGEKPFSASRFWTLHRTVDDTSILMGMSAAEIAEAASVSLSDAERYAALLGAGTAFAFERERLEEEGVRLISAVDDAFSQRLRARFGDACPSFLLIGGPTEFLELGAIGVVRSRDASPEVLEVATSVAHAAATGRRAVVSGLARGIDQAGMGGALDAGVPVVRVPTEGIRVVARAPEVRRRVHAGELCIASPYAPYTPHRRQRYGPQQDRLRAGRCDAGGVLRRRLRRYMARGTQCTAPPLRTGRRVDRQRCRPRQRQAHRGRWRPSG
jgi:predicted Rossmann fold nucleotide-binding protein DprA/Smf involved in DNA uptake